MKDSRVVGTEVNIDNCSKLLSYVSSYNICPSQAFLVTLQLIGSVVNTVPGKLTEILIVKRTRLQSYSTNYRRKNVFRIWPWLISSRDWDVGKQTLNEEDRQSVLFFDKRKKDDLKHNCEKFYF